MNGTYALAVALGGAIGAPLRVLIDARITRTAKARGVDAFPWGLLAVNVIGSLVVGLAYASANGSFRALIATGACGALTTYSSYALFIHRSWHLNRRSAWWAVIAMPVACVGACAIGVLTAGAITG